MDWTEIITAGIAALGAVGGSALMQSKATAVLQTGRTQKRCRHALPACRQAQQSDRPHDNCGMQDQGTGKRGTEK